MTFWTMRKVHLTRSCTLQSCFSGLLSPNLLSPVSSWRRFGALGSVVPKVFPPGPAKRVRRPRQRAREQRVLSASSTEVALTGREIKMSEIKISPPFSAPDHRSPGQLSRSQFFTGRGGGKHTHTPQAVLMWQLWGKLFPLRLRTGNLAETFLIPPSSPGVWE